MLKCIFTISNSFNNLYSFKAKSLEITTDISPFVEIPDSFPIFSKLSLSSVYNSNNWSSYDSN